MVCMTVTVSDEGVTLTSHIFEAPWGVFSVARPFLLKDGRLLRGYKVELIIDDPPKGVPHENLHTS